jgi:hypothetical protein
MAVEDKPHIPYAIEKQMADERLPEIIFNWVPVE